ncbi:hypothetical protein GF351_02325, partial [Candidatus Woesearchaeota archaeon]|nr:hypothetical protein [Candidatus Woesearchaeota archaeon]
MRQGIFQKRISRHRSAGCCFAALLLLAAICIICAAPALADAVPSATEVQRKDITGSDIKVTGEQLQDVNYDSDSTYITIAGETYEYAQVDGLWGDDYIVVRKPGSPDAWGFLVQDRSGPMDTYVDYQDLSTYAGKMADYTIPTSQPAQPGDTDQQPAQSSADAMPSQPAQPQPEEPPPTTASPPSPGYDYGADGNEMYKEAPLLLNSFQDDGYDPETEFTSYTKVGDNKYVIEVEGGEVIL